MHRVTHALATILKRDPFVAQVLPVTIACWLLVVVFTVGNPKVHLKSDFRHFYTQAAASRAGHYSALVSAEALELEQLHRLSTPGRFPTVYPPHLSILLNPLAALPFVPAYALWQLIVVLSAAGMSYWVSGRIPLLLPFRARVVLLSCLAPPVLYAAIAGHPSPIALVALSLVAVALDRRSPALAGAAVGLLAYKPSLFVPALAVCCLAREWVVVRSAMLVAAAQVLLVAPVVGLDVLRDYLTNITAAARSADNIAAKPQYMASLRTFWAAMLPPSAAVGAYLVTASAALFASAWGWRRATSGPECASLLGLGIALSSPHLYFYDLLVLGPTFLVTAALMLQEGERANSFRFWLLAAFLSPLLAPLAFVTHVQFVTLVLAGWMVTLLKSQSAPSVQAVHGQEF